MSWIDTPSAYHLWDRLEADCLESDGGCDVLTIPHNSNISGDGLMFQTARLTGMEDAGGPVDVEEAKL